MQSTSRCLRFFLVFAFAVTAMSVAAQDQITSAPVEPGATALQFIAVPPCRVVDTRNPNGTFGGPPIQGGTVRSFPLPVGNCALPLGAWVFSLNVTVVPHGRLGYLTIWPTGLPQPVVSTLNSVDGRVKANAAIVPSGNGMTAVSVYASDTTDVILDVNGYFSPPKINSTAFYPVTPCRIADTRSNHGGGGPISGGTTKDFQVTGITDCPVPPTATAYSLNFTALPNGPLGYLTAWPAGGAQPTVSTLNDQTGTIVANAAIVTAGVGGDISVFPTNDTNLLIDINGYFAPAGSPGALSLYVATPCRVLDTRQGAGAFSGQLVVDVLNGPCSVPPTAQAYVLNATVIPVTTLGFLTLWADGAPQPVVSTLNAVDGSITNNMAIVPTTTGKIDAYASDLTQLLLDVSSYYAP